MTHYSDQHLSKEQYAVLRNKQTEAPFTGVYLNHHEDGMYRCVGCGSQLFSSATKFDSGSGWPSFYEVMQSDAVVLTTDDTIGMHRVEVSCAKCGGHLGHVFEDGPQPTGKRYCINSCALDFTNASQDDDTIKT